MNRSLLKYIHIAAGLFNIVYFYTPVRTWQYAETIVRFGTFPALVITGILLVRMAKARG